MTIWTIATATVSASVVVVVVVSHRLLPHDDFPLSPRIVAQDNIPGVQDARQPPEKGQEEIDEEVERAPPAQQHSQRREEEGDED